MQHQHFQYNLERMTRADGVANSSLNHQDHLPYTMPCFMQLIKALCLVSIVVDRPAASMDVLAKLSIWLIIRIALQPSEAACSS